MRIKAYNNRAQAISTTAAAYANDCGQKGCPTPPAQRQTKFAWPVIKHPTRNEWALLAPDQAAVERIAPVDERTPWGDYTQASRDEWQPNPQD